jgi:polar amino acid transport system substrate-binding protein
MIVTQTSQPSRHRRLAVSRGSVVLLALPAVLLVGLAGVHAVRALMPPPQVGPPTLARALTVATVEGALPLSGSAADGRLGGVHVDVARAVCRRLGTTCRFAVVDEGTLLDRLETGAVDLIAADLLVTPAAVRRARFATPHGRIASIVVGPAALWPSPDPLDPDAGLERLSGRLVAVASGSAQAQALQSLAPADAGVVLAPSHDGVLDAMRRGEADAGILPLAVALRALGQEGGGGDEVPTDHPLAVIAGPLFRDGAGGRVALAMAPGDARLGDAVERALADLRRDGTLDAIMAGSPDPLAGAAGALPGRGLP